MPVTSDAVPKNHIDCVIDTHTLQGDKTTVVEAIEGKEGVKINSEMKTNEPPIENDTSHTVESITTEIITNKKEVEVKAFEMKATYPHPHLILQSKDSEINDSFTSVIEMPSVTDEDSILIPQMIVSERDLHRLAPKGSHRNDFHDYYVWY
jgi:hypothetical protein